MCAYTAVSLPERVRVTISQVIRSVIVLHQTHTDSSLKHHSYACLIDWAVVLRPTRHKIVGHFGDVFPSQSNDAYIAPKSKIESREHYAPEPASGNATENGDFDFHWLLETAVLAQSNKTAVETNTDQLQGDERTATRCTVWHLVLSHVKMNISTVELFYLILALESIRYFKYQSFITIS